MPHEITVAELAEVLTKLQPGDVLSPNRVGNLTIVRDGQMIGAIRLTVNMQAKDRIEMFCEEPELDHAKLP